MSQEVDRYLSKVKLRMFSMPRKAKKGIIEELRSHIVESAQSMGGPDMQGAVVSSMDTPGKTAKMYKKIYGYGLPFKIVFVILTIFIAIFTVPLWEIVNPNFSTTFVFLILIVYLFYIGSRAGKRMALTIGISACLTRFIILGLITAAAGDHVVVQGAGSAAYTWSTLLLIPIAYLPARVIEKWDAKGSHDLPDSVLQELRNCPRCHAEIPVSSKFCAECGGRVW
jgi:hypothetical protein